MAFKPTKYKLLNVATGRIFDDCEWTLTDPECDIPSLLRAVYENKTFSPNDEAKGLYRYADWMPIKRVLKHSHLPITYKSKGLGNFLGLENLYITFSGYWPKIGAKMETCSFKETEAFSVCSKLSKKHKQILVVQSAGNTARAFARVCSDNNIPIVICIPEDNIHDLWFRKPIKNCVKVVAAPHGCDYYDAIAIGEKLCSDERYLAEGGAKNIARRDGMGTTLLSAAEVIGRIPDAYFQAVGSGTGAISAWENAMRLEGDGRFGANKMRIYACQNAPYTIMYDSWKKDSKELLPITPEKSRRNAEVILAKVLSNRKPPYSIAGGLYDVLKASGGGMYKVTNDEIVYWMLQFFNTEGCDVFPAAACAIAGLKKAIEDGSIAPKDVVMLNITGGGVLNATKKGFIQKGPNLILDPDMPEEEIIAAVNSLFK